MAISFLGMVITDIDVANPRHDIAFKLLTVDQGPWVYNLAQVLVTRDHNSVYVPLGDHGSGRGAAVECQLGVNGQFLGQTGA